jgi:hypothetical protein
VFPNVVVVVGKIGKAWYSGSAAQEMMNCEQVPSAAQPGTYFADRIVDAEPSLREHYCRCRELLGNALVE